MLLLLQFLLSLSCMFDISLLLVVKETVDNCRKQNEDTSQTELGDLASSGRTRCEKARSASERSVKAILILLYSARRAVEVFRTNSDFLSVERAYESLWAIVWQRRVIRAIKPSSACLVEPLSKAVASCRTVLDGYYQVQVKRTSPLGTMPASLGVACTRHMRLY
jgi:hypothetical protein